MICKELNNMLATVSYLEQVKITYDEKTQRLDIQGQFIFYGPNL